MMLLNTHALLAGIAKAPELNLDLEESKQIAVAYANVARHYNWVVNEKAADWYNLITAVGAIYGSKLIAIRMRKKEDAKPKPATMQQAGQQSAKTQAQPAPQAQSKKDEAPKFVPAMGAAEPDYGDAAYDMH